MIKKILDSFKNKITNSQKKDNLLYEVSSMVILDASHNTLGQKGFSWENGVGGRFQRAQDQQ